MFGFHEGGGSIAIFANRRRCTGNVSQPKLCNYDVCTSPMFYQLTSSMASEAERCHAMHTCMDYPGGS